VVPETDKIAQQRQLYGESVGALLRIVTEGLGLNQSGVARVLGLSPAMLSQLARGQRVKIGNPLAVARLQALLSLAEEAPRLTQQDVATRLDEIGQSRGTMTTSQTHATSASDQAKLVRRMMRAVASGRELDAAAAALDDIAPGLAELIRAYGTGSPAEAERHLASIAHLLRPMGAGG